MYVVHGFEGVEGFAAMAAIASELVLCGRCHQRAKGLWSLGQAGFGRTEYALCSVYEGGLVKIVESESVRQALFCRKSQGNGWLERIVQSPEALNSKRESPVGGTLSSRV
jgi:hypothetical protein